jgi:TonB family protein
LNPSRRGPADGWNNVAPVYPPLAPAARVEGIAILEAVIDEDGSVRDVRLLRSAPLLDAAASEAVRQWSFADAAERSAGAGRDDDHCRVQVALKLD